MITVAVSTTNSLLDLIGDHAEPWGYVAVFVVAALESSAFTGLAVPGETLLLFAGFLAWRGDLNVFLTIAMAFVGAVVGDSIGYEIGRHLGDSVRASRVGRWVGRDRWDRARTYLREKGGRAVAVPTDVTDRAHAQAAVNRAVAEFGGLHILVNNAGVTLDNLLFKMTASGKPVTNQVM